MAIELVIEMLIETTSIEAEHIALAAGYSWQGTHNNVNRDTGIYTLYNV